MVEQSSHEASDSYLGYAYQGLYALLILLDAQDGASVCIESGDDVSLSSPGSASLFQLKHSLNNPPALTTKNDGFWKTLRIWAPRANDSLVSLHFVTSAEVSASDPLKTLATPGSDRTKLVEALVAEAQRVQDSRKEAVSKNAKLPYAERAPGCEAFLSLSATERQALVDRISIHAQNGSIADIPTKVGDKLRTFIPREIRSKVVERLIEWWDRQVTLALLGKRTREIPKSELVSRLQELAAEHLEKTLPDDFSKLKPVNTEEERGGPWEQQILLVRGGESRVHRALVARWRAREQRNRWMRDDVSLATLCNEYDDRLEEHWRDRHDPMCEDCLGASEDQACQEGLKLLDWSHLSAPNEIPPIRADWRLPFYVQGGYQQLANDLRVGWHPEYFSRLKGLAEAPAQANAIADYESPESGSSSTQTPTDAEIAKGSNSEASPSSKTPSAEGVDP
ncbi:MAG: ABC-three component system protein [Hyalangium sp.]|uniref:ABC-three component system protein n=1 Tax=Hyalangium sp. TaxID=2028555 RepID=UPI003899970C